MFSVTERARKIGQEGCRRRRVLPGGQRARVSKRPRDLQFIFFFSIFTAEEEEDELSQDKGKGPSCSLKAWLVAVSVALRRGLKERDRGWTWRKDS